jgi:hypothetical protein
VHAWKEGYRPVSRRRFAKDDALKLKLIKEPEIRVLDQDGRRVANVGWENEHADLRQRKLHAPGYLDLDLADVPRELLAAWDDLLARTPVDIYLVSDAGLGKLVLRVEHPGYGGTRVLIPANVSIDWTRASRPDLSPRLRALPHGWRGVYAKPVDWLSAEVFGGEEIRVYAEGTVVVTCIALDCRPLRVAIDVAKGATAERAVVLEPEPWVPQEIVVTDRFGREGPVALAIVDPARVPLASHARVPRGGGPYTILADGGSRGSAVRTVETLPTKEPIRLELTGIEVRLRVVDEESGDPIEGLALRLGDRPVEWRAEDGEYVLGPVDPGTIRLVDDAERTIDIRVDPAEAEKGILKKEVRVRVLPRGGS